MKNIHRALLVSASLTVMPMAAMAQIAPAVQPAVSPIVAPAPTSAVLRVGTEVPLRLREELTTKGKKIRTGYRFQLETSEPVMVQGVTVIPVGSPAVGEVTNSRNKGMWGKSGKLNARILYVMVNGRQIRLTGTFDDKGTAGGIAAVAVSAVVFLPAGFFMTGTSAKVPAGAIVKAFVDEDVPLALAAAPVQPLTVAVPAAVVNASAPAPAAVQPAPAAAAQAKVQAATAPATPR
ncbi:MAG TPA: hypothetical protein VF718_14845 [Allosphingosinicella sp.]|jgi:hypothetical protein